MGAVGLEPTEPEGEGFTVPCNCRYATPPNKLGRNEANAAYDQELKLLAKGLEPSTIRLQVGRSTN
jgi:hypothetical protein